MQLSTYTNQIIWAIFGSMSFGMIAAALLTWWVNRKKVKADTELATADKELSIVQTYDLLSKELRETVRSQGEQIATQATQISALQTKEIQYLRMIRGYQKRERDHVSEIKELRQQVKELQDQVTILQTQIA